MQETMNTDENTYGRWTPSLTVIHCFLRSSLFGRRLFLCEIRFASPVSRGFWRCEGDDHHVLLNGAVHFKSNDQIRRRLLYCIYSYTTKSQSCLRHVVIVSGVVSPRTYSINCILSRTRSKLTHVLPLMPEL